MSINTNREGTICLEKSDNGLVWTFVQDYREDERETAVQHLAHVRARQDGVRYRLVTIIDEPVA